MKKFFSICYTAILVFIIICLIIYPQKYIECSLNGIKLWAFTVLPSLLPFFFITALLTKTDSVKSLSQKLGFISKFLYGESGLAIYVQTMSFLSGYPVGVKIISELKQNGAIDNRTATKMSTFCSTSGPLFVVGAVGVNMFCDKNIGLILLISHLASAILNGVIFKFVLKNETENSPVPQLNDVDNVLYEAAYQSAISVLLVGTFVAVFYVFCQILSDFYIFSILGAPLKIFLGSNTEGFLQGIIECTNGCKTLSQNSGFLPIILSEGLVSFGGLSIICQSLVFLKRCGASVKIFSISKIVQMVVSMIICALILFLFFR